MTFRIDAKIRAKPINKIGTIYKISQVPFIGIYRSIDPSPVFYLVPMAFHDIPEGFEKVYKIPEQGDRRENTVTMYWINFLDEKTGERYAKAFEIDDIEII